MCHIKMEKRCISMFLIPATNSLFLREDSGPSFSPSINNFHKYKYVSWLLFFLISHKFGLFFLNKKTIQQELEIQYWKSGTKKKKREGRRNNQNHIFFSTCYKGSEGTHSYYSLDVQAQLGTLLFKVWLRSGWIPRGSACSWKNSP